MYNTNTEKVAYYFFVIVWFSITFSFIIGTLISNLLLLISVITISYLTKLEKSSVVILFCLVMFLLFHLCVQVIWLNFDSSNINAALYYIRGGMILVMCNQLAKINTEQLINKSTSLVVLTSLLLLQSVVFDYLSVPGSLFSLIPEKLTERAYSGFTGFFNNPNYWAIYAFLHISLLLNAIKNKVDIYNNHRMLILISLIICICSLVATGSRMGLFLLVLSFSLFIELKSVKSLMTIIVVLLLGGTVAYYQMDFLNNLDFTTLEKSLVRFERLINNASEEGRFVRAINYLDMLTINTLNLTFGLGLGQDLGDGSPHNTLILLFRDFGLFSLVGISLIYIYISLKTMLARTLEFEYLFRLFGLAIPVVILSNDISDSRPFWLIFSLYIVIVLKKIRINSG